MAVETITEAEQEVVRFLAAQPSLHEIVAFHPSEIVSRRVYDLISAERASELSADEERELKTYLYLEHFMRMMKAEAHRRLADSVLSA
ncbi:MAG TPA: hypothetical protein VFU88_09715 [Ktedonobacterales bacterium]|nr:hypothetical protein [Ktedonobacterales bacterium]